MSQGWTPPIWMYRDRRPTSDSAYFENLTRCIFQAGLSWQTVSSKWTNFRNAFHAFDIGAVASYGTEDIKRLMEDEGIIRNRRKIQATIHNAQEFERIAAEHGSFQLWIDSMDKADNYALVIRRLEGRFRHVGETTARIFLYTVGEEILFPEMAHRHQRS